MLGVSLGLVTYYITSQGYMKGLYHYISIVQLIEIQDRGEVIIYSTFHGNFFSINGDYFPLAYYYWGYDYVYVNKMEKKIN